ncbi:hypothetical protein ATKI12_7684 [Kitasatospora sp. Ki12]
MRRPPAATAPRPFVIPRTADRHSGATGGARHVTHGGRRHAE